jgi:hypothetical protein
MDPIHSAVAEAPVMPSAPSIARIAAA